MEPKDLGEVSRIQAASPAASQWDPSDYLEYEALVAETANGVGGFAVGRLVPPDEFEILNIAVAPEARRQRIGRALVEALLELHPDEPRVAGPSQNCDRQGAGPEAGNPSKAALTVFLEVRESNAEARAFYRTFGFEEVGRRKGYYRLKNLHGEGDEDAIVMKMQKW
jgi:ribosomal protein S18 acetylase RimI-like enzyme